MSDLLGPADAPNAVTVRPAESRTFDADDTFFKDCVNGVAGTGTSIQQAFLNGLLQQVRRAIRGMSITEDNADDDMLLKAIQAAIPPEQIDGSYKNLLINGDLGLNQRVFAGGALGAGIYGYDRWKADTGGASVSVSAGVVTLTSGTIVQVIEAPDLASETITVSVEDLSGGDLDVDVEGETDTISAGAGRQGVQIAVPAGSTGNITVKLAPASGAVTFRRVQLERGGAYTGWAGIDRALELLRCQRYYAKSYLYASAPGKDLSLGSGDGYMNEPVSAVFLLHGFLRGNGYEDGLTAYLPVEMRAAPTVRYWDLLGNLSKVSVFTSSAGAHAANYDPYGGGPLVSEKSVTMYRYTGTDYGHFFSYDADAEL